jgi:hypothetical protein
MDIEHREWIRVISGGAYKGPSLETIMKYTAQLATQVCNGNCTYPLCCKLTESTLPKHLIVALAWHNLKAEMKKLTEEGLVVSISGDVWGESAISLFAVMGYWVDKDFQMQNMLLFSVPFGSVRHTGKINCVVMD